ncbi:Molybdopterin oxidoreductase, iron-sulfur binding subunit [Enhygromyxa salina]|uniref:Molybdopterin oxidoreductase, iron-sulfur binding subunit n=1 Tax=Enhygromyxa salina TaxID=215803 RepID=A0A0C2CV98_9BACT|nr:Molybdopterin oxidoreductase, iron-sulfur binding subunit [Enhygromyxa salina]
MESICGDGANTGSEQCDDGNLVDGDGCDADCSYTEILGITSGGAHNCALIEGGRVRCWGWNKSGQLGLGNTVNVGDDELPSEVEDVALPAPAIQVAAGESEFTCALLDDMTVYCWGVNDLGQLGYGHVNLLDEPANTPVSVGGAVVELGVGGFHACARLDNGSARCWGLNTHGQLGYGHVNTIGDDETPSERGTVPLGGTITSIAVGAYHNCGVSMIGRVRCWGRGQDGRLGYGNTNNIGDNETPASIGDVSATPMGLNLFTKITQVTAATQHTCALFETGDVLCWGANGFGQLGQGTTANLGDDDLPATAPPVALPGPAVLISASGGHTCALLENDEVHCWGANNFGELGYGNAIVIGDDEAPADAGPVELGAPVKLLDTGFFHSCAVTRSNQVRCWGNNDTGQLGLGNTSKIGDDELPIDVAPISLL